MVELLRERHKTHFDNCQIPIRLDAIFQVDEGIWNLPILDWRGVRIKWYQLKLDRVELVDRYGRLAV